MWLGRCFRIASRRQVPLPTSMMSIPFCSASVRARTAVGVGGIGSGRDGGDRCLCEEPVLAVSVGSGGCGRQRRRSGYRRVRCCGYGCQRRLWWWWRVAGGCVTSADFGTFSAEAIVVSAFGSGSDWPRSPKAANRRAMPAQLPDRRRAQARSYCWNGDRWS